MNSKSLAGELCKLGMSALIPRAKAQPGTASSDPGSSKKKNRSRSRSAGRRRSHSRGRHGRRGHIRSRSRADRKSRGRNRRERGRKDASSSSSKSSDDRSASSTAPATYKGKYWHGDCFKARTYAALPEKVVMEALSIIDNKKRPVTYFIFCIHPKHLYAHAH